nr:serine/threonine protein kinase [Lachnospiraceae bacterium]
MDNENLYPLALPAGTVLAGQYVIERVLGEGGFGITYQALDHRSGECVAIKEFFPDSMVTRVEKTKVLPFTGERGENFSYGKDCFLQEAQTLAQFIGNEHIIRVYTYFEENNTAYFAMEYVRGKSFDRYIKDQGGKIPYEDAEQKLLPVMDALQAVHERGIIHRDVTPDNIYITDDNNVKLLDFGAARYSLGDKSQSLDVILKHGYAPREQYSRHGKQGPFTDIYALAACFYYAITGEKPADSVDRMVEDTVIRPAAMGASLPKYKEDAIMKALSIDPADRFQSVSDFKTALNEKTVLLTPAGNAAPNNRKIIPLIAAALVLILGIAGFAIFISSKGKNSSGIQENTRDAAGVDQQKETVAVQDSADDTVKADTTGNDSEKQQLSEPADDNTGNDTPQDNGKWKAAYLEEIERFEEVTGEYGGEYALMYVDDDDIPELCLDFNVVQDNYISGKGIYTYKNGSAFCVISTEQAFNKRIFYQKDSGKVTCFYRTEETRRSEYALPDGKITDSAVYVAEDDVLEEMNRYSGIYESPVFFSYEQIKALLTDGEWKEAYLNRIEQFEQNLEEHSGDKYTLVFIDDDAVPELSIEMLKAGNGIYFGPGTGVYTYLNHNVSTVVATQHDTCFIHSLYCEATPYILPTGNFYIHFDGESNSFWNHYTLSGGKVSFESYIDVDYDEI